MKKGKRSFEAVLAEAAHEGLDSISPSAGDAVFLYLKERLSTHRNPDGMDPQAFDDGLRQIFGYGAKVIEKKILERLYLKLETPQKIDGDFEFVEEVKKAQKLSDFNDPTIAEASQ